MPHLILECTSNIKEQILPEEVFARCHKVLADTVQAELKSCKSRAYQAKDFFIGGGNHHQAFVHLHVLLAEGRADEMKKQAGEKLLEVLREYFGQSLQALDAQITVLVDEFPKQFYFKSIK